VHAGDAQLDQGVLTGPDAQLLDLGPAPLVGFFDALRVDAAVQHQPLEGQPRHLPPHRVEAGQQHRLGRVVDDQVDPGDRLERADVPPLAADDAALHLIARQVQHRHHRLAGLLGGDPLDGQGDDLAGPLLALGPGLVLDVPHHQGRLALGLVLDGGDQLGLGLDRGQPGHPLKLGLALAVQLVDLGGPVSQGALALVELGGPVFQAVQLLVQPLLPVGQPVLPAFQVAAQLADLVLDRADLFFDLAAALGGLLGFGAGSLENPGGLGLGPGADVLGFGGDAVQLAAVHRLDLRRARGATPHHDEREYRREQPDHHERERQSAAHGHPFPSIALGAPLCCSYLNTRVMPWCGRAHARPPVS
jgi:hypothetical protein